MNSKAAELVFLSGQLNGTIGAMKEKRERIDIKSREFLMETLVFALYEISKMKGEK